MLNPPYDPGAIDVVDQRAQSPGRRSIATLTPDGWVIQSVPPVMPLPGILADARSRASNGLDVLAMKLHDLVLGAPDPAKTVIRPTLGAPPRRIDLSRLGMPR